MKITFFIGISFSKWLKFLTNKEIQLSIKYLFNYLIITLLSLINQVFFIPEKLFFNIKKNYRPKDPIFILGLWRSGTTLLHFLLSKDEKFCSPNNFQCIFPNTFNTMEKLFPFDVAKISAPRPQDNMTVKLNSPCEDEIALCSLIPDYALYNFFQFTQNKEYFLNFLDFENCEENITTHWLDEHKKFHNKVSHYYNNKRIIYKSPAHTARIKKLITIYPNASFIYIARHPLNFFQSSISSIQKLLKIMLPLQKLDIENLQEMIFTNNKRVLVRLDEDISLIPKENFSSVKYEDLVLAPTKTLSDIYSDLQLGFFNENQIELKRYLESIKGYKTNKYEPYSSRLKNRILKEFDLYIKKWGY